MLKNYLLIALRNLRRSKVFSLINVFGLALGMACCVLILLFVQDERSYDRVHEKGDRIYRLNKEVVPQNGGLEYHAITSGPMGPTMAAEYPEVAQTVRLLPWFSDVLLQQGETAIKVSEVVLADSNFFGVFDFQLRRGDPATALAAPLSVVLSETMARALFGNNDPMGQVVIGLNEHAYTVTGIIEDAPENVHLRYNALISWSSTGPEGLDFGWLSRWYPQAIYTYLLLAPGADVNTLAAKLPDFMTRNFPDRAEQYHLYLQPLSDIYLGSSHLLHTRSLRLSNRTYVYVFSAIALLILLIACINFMNLSTARATKRAREVGVRKVLGAYRRQLAQQFLGESMLLSVLALLLAVGLIELVLPAFNAFTGKVLALHVFGNPMVLAGLVGLTVLVGFASGMYPAFVLSGFRPVKVLRGGWKGNGRGTGPRKILVMTQFAISIVLLVGTSVVFQQMRYMQTKNLGFQQEQVLVLPIGDTGLYAQAEAFKNALLQYPEIIHATASNSVPGGGTMSYGIRAEGLPEEEGWTSDVIMVEDAGLPETYGLQMAAGRYFSDDLTTDATNALVINEALARSLGWADPVGKRLDLPGDVEEGRVIGVLKDFHMESLHHAINPLVLFMDARPGYLSLRLTGADLPGTLAFLRKTWQAFDPIYPFEYYFLDEAFAQFYLTEARLMQTLGLFAVLAILIACLGLFGLASFSAEQRIKEIGVRKVLGASAGQIVALLSKDFTRLVLIAFAVAVPLAFLALDRWLADFAFHIALRPMVFLLAGATALLIAWLTVGYQALKAALANPVDSLRYE